MADDVRVAQRRYDVAKAIYWRARDTLREAKAILKAAQEAVPPQPRKPLGPNARLRGDARVERDDKIFAMHLQGKADAEIAKKFGIAKATVYSSIHWRKRHNEAKAQEARWRAKYPVDPPFDDRTVDMTDAPSVYSAARWRYEHHYG